MNTKRFLSTVGLITSAIFVRLCAISLKTQPYIQAAAASDRTKFTTSDGAEPVGQHDRGFSIDLMPGGITQQHAHLPMMMNNYDPNLLYFDDFSDPSSGWFVGSNGNATYSYENEEYKMSIGDKWWSYEGTAPAASITGTYSVEADIRSLSANNIEYGRPSRWRFTNGRHTGSCYSQKLSLITFGTHTISPLLRSPVGHQALLLLELGSTTSRQSEMSTKSRSVLMVMYWQQ